VCDQCSDIREAKTAGLEDTLKLKGDDYNIILSVFFVPYVLTAPFLGILGKKYGPSRVLPLMMMTFGFMTLMTVAAQNFGGLLALRWFLGMAESVRRTTSRPSHANSGRLSFHSSSTIRPLSTDEESLPGD
jgi:MFS family permease